MLDQTVGAYREAAAELPGLVGTHTTGHYAEFTLTGSSRPGTLALSGSTRRAAKRGIDTTEWRHITQPLARRPPLKFIWLVENLMSVAATLMATIRAIPEPDPVFTEIQRRLCALRPSRPTASSMTIYLGNGSTI